MCATPTEETSPEAVSSSAGRPVELCWHLSADGEVRSWNDAVPDVLGYSSNRVGRRAISDYFRPDCRETVSVALEAVSDARRAVSFETTLETSDGMAIPAVFTARPLTNETAECCGITVRCRLCDDETTTAESVPTKQDDPPESVSTRADQAVSTGHEESMSSSRFTKQGDAVSSAAADDGDGSHVELYRSIVERISDPIMIQDLDGNFLFINEAVSTYSGVSTDELLGGAESQLMDSESAAAIAEQKKAVLETEKKAAYEISLTFDRTGEAHRFSTHRYPQYDSDGQLIGTMAICRDVTYVTKREQELSIFRTVIDSANDSVLIVDVASGEFIDVNETACRRLGYEREELLSRTIADINPEFTNSEGFMTALESGQTARQQPYRTEHERADGTTVPMELTTATVSVADSPVLIVIGRDITDRVDRETQLQAVDNILRHNLRNDLNTVYGLAGLIKEQADETVTGFAEGIRQNTHNLLRTGEKSRTITRLIKTDAETHTIDLSPVVSQVADEFDSCHPDILVSVDAPDSLPAIAPTRIDDAITELIENAVVHNDADIPTITIQLEQRAEAVDIVVADNGPGIPAMDRAVLQTGDALEELFHGSGLGLWLVHWIITRANGTVSVHDCESRGTEVRISLPQR